MTASGGVVLLHGHGRFGGSLIRVARAARRAGYATYAPSYPYRRSLREIVAWLAPRVAAFAEDSGGPVHFVTHSMGGLVARALIAADRPARLGRVVTIAPPHGGSELADALYRYRLGRIVLGASGTHLRTERSVEDDAHLGMIDYDLGVIAGDRSLTRVPRRLLPRPHDGKVSVASTQVAGMAGHVTIPASHTLIVYDARVVAAAMAFIANGAFEPLPPEA